MNSQRRSSDPFRWGSIRKKRSSKRGKSGSAVGTEAAALQALQSNAKNFNYPSEGFVERVEYTLLYSMLNEPNVYPEEVVKEHIDAEDFNQYLYVKDAHGQFAASSSTNAGEQKVSYAQLSALLALSAEKFPPKANDEGQNVMNSATAGTDNQSISQKLCKIILQRVVKYARDHDLDRQAEIQELLGPVERHAIKRNNKAALNQVLPFYIGYAATIITANPVPMLVGAAMMGGKDKMYEENQNMETIANESEKRADVEKTGLLDEDDWD